MAGKKIKKLTFERENWENLEKIRSIGIQLTSGNADFQGKLNGIRLEIQIEVRMGGKQRHLKEKICEILTKFQKFQPENSFNEISNRRRKFRIQRNSIED